jgi:putative acetyltransferase
MIQLSLVQPEDYAAIAAVIDAAFGQADESTLVNALRIRREVDFECCAKAHGAIVGHILFSPLALVRGEETLRASALAPLAVRTDWQRRGVGGALVRMGLEICASRSMAVVAVVGDPSYYGRFGFSGDLGRAVSSPFEFPHFQVIELETGALAGGGWTARYASAFGL